MTENAEPTIDAEKQPRVVAVVVPERLHREVQTFVEELMVRETGAESYAKFLEEFLGGAGSGRKQVTTTAEPGTGGDMLELGYES